MQLYDQLLAVAPGPVAALHRAVAVAEVAGPDAALAALAGLPLATTTCSMRSGPTCCAGPDGEAATAYRAALELCGNATEREFLCGRLESVAGG